MLKVDGPTLREDATQQHAQYVVRSQVLDDVIDILTVSIDRRENVTRRQDENVPHLLLVLFLAHSSRILPNPQQLRGMTHRTLEQRDIDGPVGQSKVILRLPDGSTPLLIRKQPFGRIHAL